MRLASAIYTHRASNGGSYILFFTTKKAAAASGLKYVQNPSAFIDGR